MMFAIEHEADHRGRGCGDDDGRLHVSIDPICDRFAQCRNP
jgi:hypothetical protein